MPQFTSKEKKRVTEGRDGERSCGGTQATEKEEEAGEELRVLKHEPQLIGRRMRRVGEGRGGRSCEFWSMEGGG